MQRAVEDRFANDVRRALVRPSGRRTWVLLGMLFTLLGLGYAWASSTVLEEVTRGDGKIIAAQNNQVVQSLDAGLIAEVAVREGDLVQQGQVMMRVDDTAALSKLGEVEERIAYLSARKARLEAEIKGTDPDFGLLGHVPDTILRGEQSLLVIRRDTLAKETAIAEEQKQQRLFEREETLLKISAAQTALALSERELEVAGKLRDARAMPVLEYLKLERQAQQDKREWSTLTATLPRIEASIREADQKIASLNSSFQAKAHEEYVESLSELAVLSETVRQLRDKAARTVLRAPVDGVINAIPLKTIGAVIQPGETLIEIVPVNDTLLVEARVRPQDIAFIHPGQDARIQVTAYDYTVYGDLAGEVERIGADSIRDEEGNVYYKIILKTQKTNLGKDTDNLPIIPGMIVSTNILTGKKTVLDYLLKPINKARSEALRER
ncbi:HlyD family type I secretion periplasmic adaptor subunit [Roseibium denhamense]|uniref:Membrane fusion protein (MFP) family protein n=2 Tax=Roseibium denhamense TaxID=76305 RepID=A0ABY1NDN1_9HYPH|nr:HlyD family type I secretion periplasmic adaptor subunit [Roseibium denhamense]SMP06953.1 membrane fusion protein, adhesin transport system [Roseibium denhamense]